LKHCAGRELAVMVVVMAVVEQTVTAAVAMMKRGELGEDLTSL
jgi:hypothetical protein